jgi:hypothetical protein
MSLQVYTGPWRGYIGRTYLGEIANEDFKISLTPEFVLHHTQKGGQTPVAAHINGVESTIGFSWKEQNKFILQIMAKWLRAKGLDPENGLAGQLRIGEHMGCLIPHVPITFYQHFCDNNNVRYGDDENNPMSIQFPNAYMSNGIEQIFNLGAEYMQEIEFTGFYDADTDIIGTIGMNKLPDPVVVFVKTLTGGTGYNSSSTLTFSNPTTGTVATGVPVVVSGSIVGVNITSGGVGYTVGENVTVTASGGTGATFKAYLG